MKAIVFADEVDRDLGLLAPHLQKVGARTEYLDRANLGSPRVTGDLLILLGSNRSAHDKAEAQVVATEVALIRSTLAQGIPVIGICYGAQVLARALGGNSQRGTVPECGWKEVSSSDETLCPSGYWGQMHRDVIVPAETSTVIGWSPAGPQAFTDSTGGARAIGWQFHPELTISTLRRWLTQHYSGSEDADLATLVAATEHAQSAQPRAAALFEATFHYLQIPISKSKSADNQGSQAPLLKSFA